MAQAPTAAVPPPTDASALPPAAAANAGSTDPDAGNADEGTESDVIATICQNKDGTYTLYAGDEPEEAGEAAEPGEGAEVAPEGKTFDTPQALLKGVMELLNDSGGAEDSFGKGFRGESDATAAKPDVPPVPGM